MHARQHKASLSAAWCPIQTGFKSCFMVTSLVSIFNMLQATIFTWPSACNKQNLICWFQLVKMTRSWQYLQSSLG